MKRLLFILGIGLAAAVPYLVPSPVRAEYGTPATKPEKEASPKPATTAGKRAEGMHATGSVTKVEGGNIEIRLKNRAASTFTTDANTKILAGDKAAGMDSVKVGERVRILYESKDGAKVAKEVHILPAKSHKGGKKAEKK